MGRGDGREQPVLRLRLGRAARLVTPALSGSLLPGITRDSLLQAAADLGIAIEEGLISVDQLREDAASGAITEVFGSGTAAVVTPIGGFKSATDWICVGDGEPGELTQRLRAHLLGVQHGATPDNHGWLYTIVPAEPSRTR